MMTSVSPTLPRGDRVEPDPTTDFASYAASAPVVSHSFLPLSERQTYAREAAVAAVALRSS